VISGLSDLLEPSRSPDEAVAVMFVDLDSFKAVNDTHGHAAGDRLLQAVADRLHGLTRKSDLVGRLGGDEFLVAVTGVTGPDDAWELARLVHDGVRGRVEVDGAVIALAASVGVTLARPGKRADDAVSAADQAMYRAKRTRAGLASAEDPGLSHSA
jgi:diguanylate cyclase (GGDEF)-like protein